MTPPAASSLGSAVRLGQLADAEQLWNDPALRAPEGRAVLLENILWSATPELTPESAAWLHAKGANFNVVRPAIPYGDTDDMPPQPVGIGILAVTSGNIPLVDWLIRENILGHPDTWTCMRGSMTALALAVRRENTPMALRLLEAGADINTRSLRGTTLLHHQARAGRMASLAFLMEHGADPTLEEGARPHFQGVLAAEVVPASLGKGWDVDAVVSELERYRQHWKAGSAPPFEVSAAFTDLVDRENTVEGRDPSTPPLPATAGSGSPPPPAPSPRPTGP